MILQYGTARLCTVVRLGCRVVAVSAAETGIPKAVHVELYCHVIAQVSTSPPSSGVAMATAREALPIWSRWRSDWSALLAERDRISCMQRGDRGPPFAKHAEGIRTVLGRLLPWNWWSLQGTGWCYDSSWDEMRRCKDLGAPVDWNGVSLLPDDETADALGLPLEQLLLVACLAFATAAIAAYQDWERQELRRRADEEEGGDQQPEEVSAPSDSAANPSDASSSSAAMAQTHAVSFTDWMHSGQARPWRWSRGALITLFGSTCGMLVALSIPLPHIGDGGQAYPSVVDEVGGR